MKFLVKIGGFAGRGFGWFIQFVGRSWLHFVCVVQAFILLIATVYWVVGLLSVKKVQKFAKDSLPPAPIEVQTVYKGTFEQKSTLAGTIQAPQHVLLKASIEGRLKRVAAKSGQIVKKGDVLFSFEDEVYKAEVQEAEAQLQLLESRYKRDIALGKKSARTAKDVEESAGQVAVQRANLEKRRAMLGRTVVRAPFSGVVGIHSLTEGAYLRPGDDMVGITQSDSVNLDFCVPEKYLDAIKKGQEVRFGVDSVVGQMFSASVEEVDSQAHPVRHCVRCRARVDGSSDALRHGLYARVQFTTRMNEGVVIAPQSAVEARGTSSYVYVVEDNKARHRNVKVGGRSGDNVEILSGLSEGDIVIVAGQIRIQDGFPVFVVPPKGLVA